MGSKHSYHERIIERYEQAPESKEKIRKLESETQKMEQELQTLRQEAQQLHDPKIFHKKTEELFQRYLEKLPGMELIETIPRNNSNEVHFAVAGPINAGKSSFLNIFLNLNLAVGVSRCTSKVEMVYPKGSTYSEQHLQFVWDCPGNEKRWEISDPITLNFIFSLDYIFLLFENSLQDPQVRDMARIIYAIHPKGLILIRTKCDEYDNNHQRTVSQQLDQDRKEAFELLGAPVPVVAISAKNVGAHEGDRYDWDILKRFFEKAKRNQPVSLDGPQRPALNLSLYADQHSKAYTSNDNNNNNISPNNNNNNGIYNKNNNNNNISSNNNNNNGIYNNNNNNNNISSNNNNNGIYNYNDNNNNGINNNRNSNLSYLKKCSACHSEISIDDSAFCENCGQPLQ